MQKVDLSVFFPAYNEEANIAKTVNNALGYLTKTAGNFEIIVVNDGSNDQTAAIVESIAKKDNHVRLLNHQTNKGYGAALISGLYGCKHPLIAFTDSDGQFDIFQLDKFLSEINQADLVVGYRQDRQDKFIRKLNAIAWGMLIRIIFGIKVKDLDCAFKLIKKEVLNRIEKLESNGAFISAELLIKAQKAGFKINEVPITHYARGGGKSTGANFKVVLRAFKELARMYSKLR